MRDGDLRGIECLRRLVVPLGGGGGVASLSLSLAPVENGTRFFLSHAPLVLT